MLEKFGGMYDGGEEETPEETPKEEEAEEALEDKIARLEAEKEALAQREKTLLDERTVFGRRTREAEERQIAFERKLADMENVINNSRKTPSPNYDGIDLSDPDELSRFIDRRADERIASRINNESESQRRYSQDYERAVNILRGDMDDAMYEEVRRNLESIKDYHTGDPVKDAEINFDKAEKLVWKARAAGGGARPVNLKKDKIEGAGVGGKGSSDTGKVKSVKLGEEERKLLAKLGKDDKWASKVLT